MQSRTSWMGALGLAVSATMGLTATAEAGLLAANSGGALIAGTQNFSNFVAPGFSVGADVDYAVFSPGTFPFADPSGGSDFVYSYQILNLDTDISKFTVGLDGDETLGAISSIPDAGAIDPTVSEYIGVGPTSGSWTFGPGTLTNGLSSAVLFFTSPQGPELDFATVTAAFAATEELPSPLPEPASLGLLAMGLGLASVRKISRG